MIKKIMLGLAVVFFATDSDARRAHSTVEQIGDWLEAALPAYALGWTMMESDWEGAKQLAYSYFATMGTVHGMKLAIDAERPDGTDNRSFPSGHTASAFAGATFIHKRYGLEQAAIPYALAAFTGYSRVYADRHFWDDVIAGAAISFLFTWILVDRYENFQVAADLNSARLSFKMAF
ncbi:MAG: phosphatase PAP2 family protein [Alphaproteobacteria bacterium]|nr:phosphatase PAP2 family protein [Alphaproteobacteria bacterium]